MAFSIAEPSIVAVTLGGGLGALARHAVTEWVTRRWPVSTLIVNVVGSGLLGVGLAMFPEEGGAATRAMLGFCGGFTTFSSFAWQTLELQRGATSLQAAGNLVANLVGSWGAFAAGLAVGLALGPAL